MTTELQRIMPAVVEDMKVGDPIRVSWAGLRNGGELEEWQFRLCLYGLKILQGKIVFYDSLLFKFALLFGAFCEWVGSSE